MLLNYYELVTRKRVVACVVVMISWNESFGGLLSVQILKPARRNVNKIHFRGNCNAPTGPPARHSLRGMYRHIIKGIAGKCTT